MLLVYFVRSLVRSLVLYVVRYFVSCVVRGLFL